MDQTIKSLEDIGELLLRYELKEEINRINSARERYETDHFSVLITGEYGRGKSTLLNAMLGEEVFRTSLLREATINTLSYNPDKSAQVTSTEGTSIIEIDQIPSSENQTKIELNWPLDFLSTDSICTEYPSISEPVNCADLLAVVQQADLVVFVIACDSLYSNVEANTYRNLLKTNGHTRPIFVCNFLDRISDKDKAEVVEAAKIRLPVNEDHIFLLSAQDALEGKKESASTLTGLKSKLNKKLEQKESIKRQRVIRTALVQLEKLKQYWTASEDSKTVNENSSPIDAKKVRDQLQELRKLSSQLQLDFNSWRTNTQDIVQTKLSHFWKELERHIERFVENYTGDNLSVDLNQEVQNKISTFSQKDFSSFIKQSLEEQKELLQIGFTQYQQGLRKLYGSLPEDMPDVSANFAPLYIANDLSSPRLDQTKHANEATDKKFKINNLFEVPEALLTLMGAAIGSIIYAQFALIILPVGIGTSLFLLSRRWRNQSNVVDTSKYTKQIRSQSQRAESKTLGQMKAEFDRLQGQVKEILNSTTRQAERDTNQLLSAKESKSDQLQKDKTQVQQLKETLENLL